MGEREKWDLYFRESARLQSYGKSKTGLKKSSWSIKFPSSSRVNRVKGRLFKKSNEPTAVSCGSLSKSMRENNYPREEELAIWWRMVSFWLKYLGGPPKFGWRLIKRKKQKDEKNCLKRQDRSIVAVASQVEPFFFFKGKICRLWAAELAWAEASYIVCRLSESVDILLYF